MFRRQAAADLASRGGRPLLTDREVAVRYWAAHGYLVRREVDDALRTAMKDPSPYVRAVAAEAAGRYGSEADAKAAVAVLLELASADKNGFFVALAALTGLDAMGIRAGAAKHAVGKLPLEAAAADGRYQTYIPRLIEKIQSGL